MDELIERALRGETSDHELAVLASWRAADVANERHYTDLVRILEATASLRSELTAHAPPRSLANRLAGSTISDIRPIRGPSADEQAALQPRRSHEGYGSRAWRRNAPWFVAAAAIVLMMLNVVQPFVVPPALNGHHADVVTGPGEITTVQLGDGSVIRLAPSSRLRLGEDGDARLVGLDGRAFFSVAQASGRPFRVRTSAGTATVLGTRFEIVTGDAGLQLVVIEGRVALDAPDNRVIVAAGEQSLVANRSATAPAPIGDAEDILRWTGRFLAFQGTPLRDAVREIEVMYGIRMTIAEPSLGDRTVTAVFTGRDLSRVLEVMCEIIDARCVVHPDSVTVLPR